MYKGYKQDKGNILNLYIDFSYWLGFAFLLSVFFFLLLSLLNQWDMINRELFLYHVAFTSCIIHVCCFSKMIERLLAVFSGVEKMVFIFTIFSIGLWLQRIIFIDSFGTYSFENMYITRVFTLFLLISACFLSVSMLIWWILYIPFWMFLLTKKKFFSVFSSLSLIFIFSFVIPEYSRVILEDYKYLIKKTAYNFDFIGISRFVCNNPQAHIIKNEGEIYKYLPIESNQALIIDKDKTTSNEIFFKKVQCNL